MRQLAKGDNINNQSHGTESRHKLAITAVRIAVLSLTSASLNLRSQRSLGLAVFRLDDTSVVRLTGE